MKLHEYQIEFNDLISMFTNEIRLRYETLHKDLLYTDEQQCFEEVLKTFKAIDNIFKEIDE